MVGASLDASTSQKRKQFNADLEEVLSNAAM